MSKLWVITSYFNPVGFNHRLSNYRIFREHLDVSLATVELSFDGEFALEDSDADILLRLKTEDVMWQKERLLNLVVESLPEECDQVAWVDCDVIFGSKDWMTHAEKMLEHSELVHLFDHRIELPKSCPLSELGTEKISFSDNKKTPSAIYLMSRGEACDDDFQRANSPLAKRSTVGLGWACSRELLSTHGLYDACIIGGGDRAILGAALGRFHLGIEALNMKDKTAEHYLSWARPFHDSIKSKVSHIPGHVYHLWHGELQNRQYESRLKILNRHNFDPLEDLSLDSQGLWKWASDKPELHNEVKAYFPSRKEDGIDY